MPREVKIGLIQMSMSAVAEENLNKAEQMVTDAREMGAQIVCLPELFTGPYFCSSPATNFDYAEELSGRTQHRLSDLARRLKIVLVGGSIHEHAGNEYFNTSMVFDETGTMKGYYRKTHIPHDESFFEQDYFKPGNSGYKVFETSFGRIAVLICYDQWFPEAARIVSLMGAEIIFYPTAIGTLADVPQAEGDWHKAWENVQRGHAIANGTVVAAVNRAGKEGKMNFWGGSFICNAFGKTLVRADNQEQTVVHSVDLEHGELVKEGWRFFYNRRPDTYQRLLK